MQFYVNKSALIVTATPSQATINGKCPGGGFAKSCETKNGKRVTLIDHMKDHWKAIGFVPCDFENTLHTALNALLASASNIGEIRTRVILS